MLAHLKIRSVLCEAYLSGLAGVRDQYCLHRAAMMMMMMTMIMMTMMAMIMMPMEIMTGQIHNLNIFSFCSEALLTTKVQFNATHEHAQL